MKNGHGGTLPSIAFRFMETKALNIYSYYEMRTENCLQDISCYGVVMIIEIKGSLVGSS
mgnify:CR=1 FL=1